MIIITNLNNGLSKNISLENLSFGDFKRIISFYSNVKGYDYKIIR